MSYNPPTRAEAEVDMSDTASLTANVLAHDARHLKVKAIPVPDIGNVLLRFVVPATGESITFGDTLFGLKDLLFKAAHALANLEEADA